MIIKHAQIHVTKQTLSLNDEELGKTEDRNLNKTSKSHCILLRKPIQSLAFHEDEITASRNGEQKRKVKKQKMRRAPT